MTPAAHLLSLDQLSGHYPSSFSKEVAGLLGRAFPTYLRRKNVPSTPILLARAHDSASASLRDAFVCGLVLSGSNVHELETLSLRDWTSYVNHHQSALSVYIGPQTETSQFIAVPKETPHVIHFFVKGEFLREAALSALVNIADGGNYYSGTGTLSFGKHP